MKTETNKQHKVFMCYLAMLAMLGFTATDMYLPAFKDIETTFGASVSQVSLSLTTFLAGMALGQLVYGRLVQQIGSRNALLAGMALFGISSVLIAASDSILTLNIARFFQGLGVCAATVIWQALVVEQYSAQRSQEIFGAIMPWTALSPALAPTLGALVQQQWDWRAIFIVLACLAVALVLSTWVFVKPKASDVIAEIETKEQEKPTQAKGFQAMLRNRIFTGNVLIFGGCSGAFFAYITVWPQVMQSYGYDANAIGLSFIPQTILFIVGGYLSQRLVKVYGTQKALTILLGIFALSVAAISISTLVIDSQSIYPLLIAFCVLAAANGGIYPVVVGHALQQFTQDATRAAGLQNFIQTCLSFAASSFVASIAMYGDAAIGAGILVSAVVILFGYFYQRSSAISN